jgi:hypothetical protein
MVGRVIARRVEQPVIGECGHWIPSQIHCNEIILVYRYLVGGGLDYPVATVVNSTGQRDIRCCLK